MPYKLVQRISVAGEHYSGVIMMEDIQTEKSENNANDLLAAMITVNGDTDPVKVIKFKRNEDTSKTWNNQVQVKSVKMPHQEVIKNCFLVNKERILISSTHYLTILDSNMEQLKQVFISVSNSRFRLVTCCRSGIKTGRNERILLAVDSDLRENRKGFNPT